MLTQLIHVLFSFLQAMVDNLYDHFRVLYRAILPRHPTLAAEHALKQEDEVYQRTTKITYRNAVISSIATVKSRSPPTSLSHPSVGTSASIAHRAELASSLATHRLTPPELAPLVLSRDELVRWGYVADVSVEWGPGGGTPSALGERVTCERCKTVYVVHTVNDASENECSYHWGRAFFTSVDGERKKIYTCCQRTVDDGGGCSRGPHVFYESDPAALHARHAFISTSTISTSATATAPSTLSEARAELPQRHDAVALDCEMVYTTGGFRVARVSVVDAAGDEIFDEYVKMDDGVDVVDFNTRFSGIAPHAYAERARDTLDQIRARLLAHVLDAHTVIIGHGLENDLKTLRLVHARVIDTVALFPHPRGFPYRRALRELAKEHLSRTIQRGGGTTGHSSVEDSVATLDLVKFFVLNKMTKPALPAATSATAPSFDRPRSGMAPLAPFAVASQAVPASTSSQPVPASSKPVPASALTPALSTAATTTASATVPMRSRPPSTPVRMTSPPPPVLKSLPRSPPHARSPPRSPRSPPSHTKSPPRQQQKPKKPLFLD